jgi:hypothetical protein
MVIFFLQPLIWEERKNRRKKNVDLRKEIYTIEEHEENKIEIIHFFFLLQIHFLFNQIILCKYLSKYFKKLSIKAIF